MKMGAGYGYGPKSTPKTPEGISAERFTGNESTFGLDQCEPKAGNFRTTVLLPFVILQKQIPVTVA
jgi:hypothetical protein